MFGFGSAPVSGLLGSGRPATITWLISLIVVDTVEAESGWTFMHILQEIFKFAPPLADGDAATPIIFIGRMSLTAAPVKHTHPRLVCVAVFLFLDPDRVTMSEHDAANCFELKTAARFGATVSQAPSHYAQLHAAGTLATPKHFLFGSVGNSENDQPPKALTCDIDESAHDGLHTRLLREVTAGPARVRPLRCQDSTNA